MQNKYIGIFFELAHKYTNSLEKLFDGLDVESYNWYTADSENYISENGKRATFFLPDGIYSGIEFKKEICKPEYYIHLLSLYGVPKDKEFQINEIAVYEDYLNSNAEIALFSGDSIVSLYAKKPEVLNTIKTSCMNNAGSFIDTTRFQVELFTKETDDRTAFHV